MQQHAPLQHELRDDAVEGAALVAKARLAGAQRAEVLRRLGHVLAEQAEGDLARRLAACAFSAASAAQPRRPGWRGVALGGAPICKRGARQRRTGAALRSRTHRDVEEHLPAMKGNRKPQRTACAAAAAGPQARTPHGARPCIGALRPAPTRALRTFFVTLGAAATVVAEKALYCRRARHN